MATKAKRAAKNSGRTIASARPRARRTAAPKPAVRPPARPQLPGLVRRAVLEQLEPRLLLSADLNPLATDALFAAPSTLPAEFRSLTDVGTPSVVISAAAAPVQRASELVFVDTATPDYQRLVAEMRATAQAEGRTLDFVMIDSRRDGVNAITETLAKRSDLDAVHIISHAQDGAVQLGSTELDFETLVERAAQIKKWGNALTAGGDILFYGCDLAENADGKALVDAIARLTGADVAASENLTGAAAEGGDWTLEYHVGAVDTTSVVSAETQSEWDYLLATFTVTNTNDSGSGSLRGAIAQANVAVGPDTIQFALSAADPNYSAGTGVWTIDLNSALTVLPLLASDTTIIDGWSQPGWVNKPVIELTRGGGGNYDGLDLLAGSSTVRGLIIDGFHANGSLVGGTGIFVGPNATAVIQGNYIGTNATGTAASPNEAWGIWLQSSGNTVGGTNAADRNIISGNGVDGIYVDGSSGGSGNVIQGNYIGTNVAGSGSGMGNRETGIWIANSNSNTIGGAAAGAGNVISGNGFSGPWQGMLVQNSDGNLIQGNRIGTDAAGNAALPNALEGIELNTGADNNSIIGNLISGNTKDGIVIWQSTGNVVRSNNIGTNLAGTGAIANGKFGVWITDAANNTIGGTTAGDGNLISGNTLAGVEVDGTQTTASGNAILGNAISNNGGLGIDLVGVAGVNFNDALPGDLDTGPNGLQNYPVLALAITNGSQIQISGAFNSTVNSTFRIEFFASATQDPSGRGEGQRYLGFVNVTTDSSGNATLSKIVLPGAVLVGEYISATATNTATNNTSEFAQNIQATPAHEIRGTVFDDVDADADIAEAGTLTLANASISLYLDNGDGVIGTGDLLQSTVTTNAAGQYTFSNLLDGTYYVAVDSKTLSGTNVWAEQTYGVAGAAKGAGFTATSGALFGGRNAGISDDASSLVTAEHVTQVSVANANVVSVNYGFSFSAITNNRGDVADDDQATSPGTPRLQQGTLRQFILNSNAIAGVQTAHFAIGAPGTPVTIAVSGAALPTITDAAFLDAWTQGGTGYSGVPLVELAGAGAGPAANGLTITAGGTGVRGFVINAFSGRGISIVGGGGNVVTGNYVGTDSNGALDRGNAFSGIFLDNSAGNTIGGAGAAERNVISGNDLDGISVSGAGSSGNQILGNYIGVNAAGAAPIGNGESAVDIDTGASNNVVRGNVLSGNAQYGVDVSDATTSLNVIAGNTIGLDAGGTVSIANTLGGVVINAGAVNNTIGGTAAVDRNVISGNASIGVLLDGATGTIVAGNYIGTDRTGTLARGNADDGVRIQGTATGNTIGGPVAAARNVISSNLSDGVEIRGNGNVVAGNYIGLDATGGSPLGNSQEGLDISGSGNTIGGTGPNDRNVIAANASHGVMLSGGSATLNRVIGNYIGTDAGGTLDRGNADGVRIQSGANANTIGGTTAAERNVISGNDSDGIDIRDGGTSGNIVAGNYIGTTGTGGAALANSESGIEVSNANNIIGGTAANAGNTIAYNAQNGVIVTGGSTIGVAVWGNSIYSNSGIGIDLGANGPTPNDLGVGDADTGPNGLQNFPVLTGAAVNGAIVSIAGGIDSTPGTSYRVEFFATTAGGVQRYLGTTTVPVGAAGTATFLANVTPAVAVAVGETITATATNLANNSTSELSAAVTATSGFSISGTIFNDANANGNITDDSGAVFAGTEVRLHLDDGDGVIDSGDSFVGITTTGLGGTYSFGGLAPGTYYVVVNSRTIDAGAGNYNAGFTQANVWAEQTYGVTGAASATGFLSTAASLSGGRNAAVSDNAAGAITTAEHVTKVSLAGGNVTGVDSGFSFNAIVNTRGDPNDDDGAGTGRLQQGSLQQFILNANAIIGIQTSNFSIGGGGPQTIALTAPLPTITQSVVLDATSQELFSGTPLIELNGAGAGASATGLTIGAGNSIVRGFVINRFGLDGIAIVAGSDSTIAGNWIGTNAFGTADAGNGRYGIRVTAAANTIGGLNPTGADRNVISGNDSDGIQLAGNSNAVVGNYIGTDATGMSAIANTEDGIWVSTASNNTIGGSNVNARNVISGNAGSGVDLSGGGSGNVIRGNYIGQNKNATAAVANLKQGVYIHDGTGTQVGGTGAGDGNIISGNAGRGVEVDSGSGGSIQRNSIHTNGGLGIDLSATPGGDGITPNDAGDVDAGGNYLQNSPVIDAATVSGGTVTVGGHFALADGSRTRANSTYTIDFYANPATASGREGRTYLGSASVTTDANGDAAFASGTLAFAGNVVGDRVTATATMVSSTGGFGAEIGSTSEFSASFVTTSPGAVTIAATTSAAEPATNGLFTVSISQASAVNTVISYTVAGTATAGSDYTALSGTINIPAFAMSATIGVPVLDDALLEASETVIVTLNSVISGAPGIVIGAASSATVSIADNDLATATLSAANGAEGGASVVYTVTLSKANNTGSAITFSLADLLTGSATTGSDYTAIPGGATISVANGAATGSYTVNVIDDALLETTETISAQISNSSFGAVSITGANASASIADNDLATATLSATNGTEGGANVVYTVTLSQVNNTGSAITFNLADLLTGSATSGVDYAAIPGGAQISVANGVSAGSYTVNVIDDAFVEPSETINARISGSSNPAVSIAGATAAASILDNDVPPVNTVPGPQTVAEDTLLAIGGISVNDLNGNLSTVALAVVNGTVAVTLQGAATISAGANGTGTLTISGTQAEINATLATLAYQGNPNFNGADTLNVTSTDTGSATDLDTIAITVTPVNDAPVANNVSASGNEDDPQIALTLTGSDIEGPVASFRIVGALPANGLLYVDVALTTLAASGTDYAASGNALTLYFVPAANWNGSTGFQFTANDGGGLSDASPATATINVAAVNDAPVANNVSVSGNEDDPQIAITLTGSDIEGPVASFRITGSLPANGTLYTNAALTAVAVSGIDYAATGNALTLYFVPAANWNGTTGFQFTATDGGGLVDPSPATATINVAAVNDAPVASDVVATGNEDDPQIAVILAGSDVEGPVTSFRLLALPAPATGALYTDPSLTTLAAAGIDYAAVGNALTLYFVPTANWNGSTGFQFTATDAGGLADPSPANATVNVAAVNDAPMANNVFANGNEDDPQIAIVLSGSDVEGPVSSFRIVGALPANGTLYTNAALTAVAVSGIDYAAPGNALTLYFVPAANWNGLTSFQFTATDGGGLSAATPATAVINVAPANDAPAANDVTANGNEGDPQIALTLTGSDIEGPVASFRITGALPANGMLYTDAALTTVAVSAIDYAASGNALTLYFVPAANWNGTTGFQFSATDGGGLADPTPANATINVAPVNDAPVANDVIANGNEDDPQIAITLTGSDIDGPIASFRLASLPSNGVLYADTALTALAAIGPNYAATGNALTLYFVPAPNWNGSTSFQFTATDGGGLDDATLANATINVAAVNDAPTANDVVANGNEDDPQIAITLTGSDIEGPVVSFRLAALPANGLLYTDAGLTTLAAAGTDYGAVGSALTLYFAPAANWNGTTTFQFTATDGGGLSDATSATATINVAAVNDAPAANNVVANGNEDDPQIAITLIGSDVEGPVASFRITGALPANGTLYTDGALTTVAVSGIDYPAAGNALTLYFVPVANWNGTTAFQFTATDGGGLSDTTAATATINVVAVNDAPVANDVVANGNEDDPQIALTLTGSDIEAPVASFRITGALPANGTLYTDAALTIVAASGIDYPAAGNALTLYFVPAANWNGSTTFQFTTTDASGLSDATPASATINVASVNDVPLAAADAVATNENTSVTTADVLVNDTLGDQPTAIVAFDALSAQGGTVSLNAGNTFTYTPVATFSGLDTFTYTIRDADGETSTATVTVTVVNVANDPPVNIVPGAQISAEDVALVFSTGTGNRIAVSDPDAGTNPLQVTLTATNGTLTLAGTAGLTFAVGSGTADGTMTFTGTAAAINAALDGMTFLPPLNYDGPASVTVTTNDLGSTGAGGPQSDSDTVNITVAVVNDSPTLDLDANNSSGATGADYQSTFTEGGLPVRIADLDATLADIDSPNLASLTVTITNLLDGVDEILTANTAGTSITATYVAGSGVLTLNGADTVANYQTVLRTIRYENLSDAPSPAQRVITFVASDGGSASNVATARVTIAPVNDAPTAAFAAASYTATENVLLDLHGTGMSVGDIDALPSSVVTVQLSSISGFLSASAGTTGVAVAGSGTPTLTFNGTLAQINSLLAGGGAGWVRYLVGSDSPAPTDTLDLSITDNGATGSGGALWGFDSVTVNLIAVNDAPIITIPGLVSTPEDTTLVFSTGGGDLISITDVDAAGFPVQVTLNVSNGVITLAGTTGLAFTTGDGTADASMTFTGTVANVNAALDGLAFMPTPDYSGPAFLSLSVNDQGNSGLGGPLTDADFASITVTGVNDAPAGTDATIAMAPNTSYAFTAASFGFTDGDAGDTLAAVRIDALPAAGSLTLSGSAAAAGQVIAIADINAGNLVFTPAPAGTGTPYASFAFSVQDNTGAFDIAPNTITVNVAPIVNNPPTGTDGAVTTTPGVGYVFTLADFGYSDPDAGDVMSEVRIDSLPSALVGTLNRGGLAMLVPGQVLTRAEIIAGDLTFQPLLFLTGTTNFDFSVRDTNGPVFDVVPNTMVVTIAVPTNDPVNVVPGAKVVNEDTALAVTGLSVNDPNGNLVSVQLGVLNGTLNATAAGTAALAGIGTAAVTITGSQADINATLATVSYQGNLNFAGSDTLTVRSTDSGGLFDQDTVGITVNPVNDAPTAAAPPNYSAVEQTLLTLHGTGLAVADIDAGAANVVATLSAITGAIFLNPAGSTVAVSGSGTPLVTLVGSIGAINALLAGGIPGGTVTYLVTSDSPPATDTLTLTINDGGATGAGGPRTATATSTIQIGATNDAPVNTLPGGSTTLEDTPYVFSAGFGNQISVTDVDAGSAPLQVTLNASNGVITLGGVGGLAFSTGDGTADVSMTFTGALPAINAALNGLVFTPNLNYNGLAFITLTTNDLGATGSGGALSDADLATIDVVPVNDTPDGTDTTVTLNEDSTYTFSLGDFGFNDVDSGDAMTEVRIDSISLPAGATLQLGGVNVAPTQVITVADINAGLLVFTPAPDANGAGYASFTFSVRDTGVPPGALFDTMPNTMTVNVAPVNDLPIITSDGGGVAAAFVVAENTTAVTTVTASDVDLQPLTFSLAGVDAGLFSIDSVTGVLTFNPAPNFEAPTDTGADNVYNVTVRVSDGAGGFDTQALTITVVDANDAPVAADDAYVTTEDTPLAIPASGLLVNDTDEDLNPLTAVLVSGPANGSVVLNADGSFVYTPNANFYGTDTFTYEATDGALASAVATVTLTVTPLNDAPAGADSNVFAGAQYVFDASDFGYADVDGDPLDHLTITSLPADGTLLFNGLAAAVNQDVTPADLAAGKLVYVPPTTGGAIAASFGFLVHDATSTAAAANTMTIGFAAPPAPSAPPAPPAPISPPATTPSTPPAAQPPAGSGSGGSGTAPSGGGRGGGGGGGEAAGPGPSETAAPAPDAGAAAGTAAAATTAGTVVTSVPQVGSPPTGTIGFQSSALSTDPRAAAGVPPAESRGEAAVGEIKAEMQAVAAMAAPEVRQALDEARERAQEDVKVEARVAGSVFVVSTGLSVGYVLWLLRGGALIASLLSSLPAWRLVDPLPVLGSMGGRAGDEDDDSLEDLVADDRDARGAPDDDAVPDNDDAGRVRT